jgi:hypothetical protein
MSITNYRFAFQVTPQTSFTLSVERAGTHTQDLANPRPIRSSATGTTH